MKSEKDHIQLLNIRPVTPSTTALTHAALVYAVRRVLVPSIAVAAHSATMYWCYLMALSRRFIARMRYSTRRDFDTIHITRHLFASLLRPTAPVSVEYHNIVDICRRADVIAGRKAARIVTMRHRGRRRGRVRQCLNTTCR